MYILRASWKISYYIEDIQIFGMNMPFISSSEAKNAYFKSGEATNEILYVCSNINIYESILTTILHYATLYSPE